MNRDSDSEPRYPGLPPAATPEEIAELDEREAERIRRRWAMFDASCDVLDYLQKRRRWMEDNYG